MLLFKAHATMPASEECSLEASRLYDDRKSSALMSEDSVTTRSYWNLDIRALR